MKLYESIVNNLKEAETIGDLLEEIDNAYDIGTIESIGKRFKNEMDRKTIEDEVTAIEEEYGDVYSMDEDSDEYASILDELKSCIASDFSGEEENMNETDEIKEGTLEPQYSTRKSFYGKANVNDNDNTLVSYGTPIMKINDGKIEMLCRPEHLTQTTIRHIREFMQQNGMDPLPKNKLIGLINNSIDESEEAEDNYFLTYVVGDFTDSDKDAKEVAESLKKAYPDINVEYIPRVDKDGVWFIDIVGSEEEVGRFARTWEPIKEYPDENGEYGIRPIDEKEESTNKDLYNDLLQKINSAFKEITGGNLSKNNIYLILPEDNKKVNKYALCNKRYNMGIEEKNNPYIKALKNIGATNIKVNNLGDIEFNLASLNEYEDMDNYRSYKKFAHVNDVWDYLEGSNSEEDLKNRIADVDPKKFGSIYYDLHNDGNGATVIIDYQDDNEDYYEKVDVYFDEEAINESVTINGVNYYRVLDESGEEYYSIDPESITTNITEAAEPAKQNKIPRNWKKIYGEMVGDSSGGKAGDKFEITKDEYDRPIMKYEDGKEYQANWSMIRSPEMVKITNVELNETENLKESSNTIWSSEITEDNFDDAVIEENYNDYVANFDTTFKPMTYEEFLDSDWLYNFLQTAFENEEDDIEWADYINNYPESSLKEYYQEYLDENKDTKEEPISYGAYKDNYINDNSGDEWEYLQEDFLENICPMIDKQINNDILIVSGNYNSNYPDFRKSGPGGKFLNKAEDLLDWLSNEDRVDILNNDGIVGVAAYDHDGSIGGNLYTLPDDKELLYEIAKKTDYYDEDRDMEDVLGEFSYDLNHGNIDMSDLRDYADKFVPIKVEW